MSLQEWVRAMPFEFWLGFAFAVIPFLIAIYQLYEGNNRPAARFFLFGTICVVGVLVWIFFREHDKPDHPLSTSTRTWGILKNEPWVNAWPSMAREPDGVLARNYNRGGRFKALTMWVDGIVFTRERTILHLAIKNWTADTTASLEPASGAYIIDDQGRRYGYQAEDRYGQSDDPFLLSGIVTPNTTELFELSFAPIQQPTGSLVIDHPQFLPITMYQHAPAPAMVNFCRPPQVTGWNATVSISCDEQHVADFPGGFSNVSQGHSAKVSLKPGKHNCNITTSTILIKDVSKELNVHAGEDYYIQTGFEWKMGQFDIKSVTTEAECMKVQ